jgi:hypothetical protein
MTRQDKIYEIRRIIDDFGEFGGDHLQVRVVLKTFPNGMRQVVDAFYRDKVEVATYMGNKKTRIDYMTYDYLPENILDEILVVGNEWEKSNERIHPHHGMPETHQPPHDVPPGHEEGHPGGGHGEHTPPGHEEGHPGGGHGQGGNPPHETPPGHEGGHPGGGHGQAEPKHGKHGMDEGHIET